MNDLQKKTARAIVNIFETGQVAGDYGSVTLIKGDPGHLTYGRSQTTLGSGNLYLLMKAYCERQGAVFAQQLKPYLRQLLARDLSLDNDATFRDLLREAGHDDPMMREEQDRFFDANYLDPACSTAQARGIGTPLGITVLYDSFIQGGFRKVVPLVGCQIGETGIDERQWVVKYIDARKGWLSSLAAPLPKTVYRMDALKKLASDGSWDLLLDLTVRGHVISEETLKDGMPVVRAAAVDPGDPPPARILQLDTPYIKGDDVRRVQEALNTNGFRNDPDGIFGPFTETLVRAFQKAKQMRVDGVVGPATRAILGL